MTRSEAREDMDEPRPRRLFRCKDRTCGGLDCASCYSPQEVREYLAELDAEDKEADEDDDE